MHSAIFKIYNASAGSGKTFSLVRDYLIELFRSQEPYPFGSLLAITFTNKAVGEMKGRIMDALFNFAFVTDTNSNKELRAALCSELKIDALVLQQRSEKLLRHLVFNYGSFQVSTIDKFNQNLIRIFAYELRLPAKFEVELDAHMVIAKAVDNLLEKTGDDETLSHALIDFAIEKTDADKSFDISRDINKIGKLLINENHIPYLDLLNEKTLEDFKILRAGLNKQISGLKKKIVLKAGYVLDILQDHDLGFRDFKYGTLPRHFEYIHKGETETKKLYNNKLRQNLEEGDLYSKTLENDKKAAIDSLREELERTYLQLREMILELNFLMNIFKNSGPLSVLILLQKEIDQIQAEEEIVLISEFNSIVSKHIREQPVPFIYERLGERFDHYFIDEFQDTSVLQWNNIIPLIDNALASPPSSLTLVGDAKQAIYRWRGGRAEQFISLYSNSENPFNTDVNNINLEKNYRSFETIVRFNNGFFKYVSENTLNNPEHQELYKLSSQEAVKGGNGYVRVEFISGADKDELADQYARYCLDSIENCIERGFSYDDICILVRKNKDGVFLAEYLNENCDYPILSSEALLLQNNPDVNFIIDFLSLLKEPENQDYQFNIIGYLTENHLNSFDAHEVFRELHDPDFLSFLNSLENYDLKFDFELADSFSLYELVEYVIYVFQLNKKPNAYLLHLLDFISDFSKGENQDIHAFVQHYEDKKDNLSISIPDELNAIRIMTVHKAKGLEFPVILYPFADLGLHDERNSMTWFDLDAESFVKFPFFHINLNKDIRDLSDYGAAIYENRMNELELDTVNLIYVAFTRAIQELYVFGKDPDSEENSSQQRINHILYDYLSTGNKDQMIFEFGKQGENQISRGEKAQSEYLLNLLSTPKSSLPLRIVGNASYLWDEKTFSAVERGNLIHEIMSRIYVGSDIDYAFQSSTEEGLIDEQQANLIREQVEKLINHEQLSRLFEPDNVVYNERDVILGNGEILRPDRVVILPSDEAVILDYKTGSHRPEYEAQINTYAQAYEALGRPVNEKKIIYINENIEIIDI